MDFEPGTLAHDPLPTSCDIRLSDGVWATTGAKPAFQNAVFAGQQEELIYLAHSLSLHPSCSSVSVVSGNQGILLAISTLAK